MTFAMRFFSDICGPFECVVTVCLAFGVLHVLLLFAVVLGLSGQFVLDGDSCESLQFLVSGEYSQYCLIRLGMAHRCFV